MSAHTLGPWHYGQVKENPIFDIIGPDLTGRGREVVGTFRATQSRVANLANARLIAAAPDLLAVAIAAVEWAESVPAPYRDWPFITKAREAIAKAEGGE